MIKLLDVIYKRKSVRSYDGTGLKQEELETLKKCMSEIANPFGIPVRFVLLDAEKHGLSSPVLTGEKYYVAGIVPKVPNAEVAYGYSFEKLILFATSLGIGTVWIGGTMPREKFEQAAGLSEGEMMPCITPIGYPAKKRSFKETMMRKTIRADSRMLSKKFVFDEVPDWPLEYEQKTQIGDLIEMVRWAPSAVNRQPWRIIVKDNLYHFYEKKERGFVKEATGDLQKIDVGIALCHFVAGLNERGIWPEIVIDDPKIKIPEDMEYIASVKALFPKKPDDAENMADAENVPDAEETFSDTEIAPADVKESSESAEDKEE